MAKEIRHMCIDVKGVLNWKPKKLIGLFHNDDGSKVSIDVIKDYLYDKLADGYEVIPMGKECDNFDKKKGCLGHKCED